MFQAHESSNRSASLPIATCLLMFVSGSCSPDLNEELAGRRFISQVVMEQGQTRPLVPDTSLGLGFDEDENYLSASAGCNGFSAEYRIHNDILQLGRGTITLQDCETPLDEQERWYFDLLDAGPTLSLDDDRLVLERDDTRIEYLDREIAIPDRPLVETMWIVSDYIDGELAVGGTWDPPASMTLNPDGTATLFTGCNTGFGSYVIESDTLLFTDLGYTKKACPEDHHFPIEDYWHRTIQDSAETENKISWTINEHRLTLRNGNYGIAFRASP